MKNLYLAIPIGFVLLVVYDMGSSYPGYTVGGPNIVASIIISFGLFISGRLYEREK